MGREASGPGIPSLTEMQIADDGKIEFLRIHIYILHQFSFVCKGVVRRV
jgi:hypothetical protein